MLGFSCRTEEDCRSILRALIRKANDRVSRDGDDAMAVVVLEQALVRRGQPDAVAAAFLVMINDDGVLLRSNLALPPELASLSPFGPAIRPCAIPRHCAPGRRSPWTFTREPDRHCLQPAHRRGWMNPRSQMSTRSRFRSFGRLTERRRTINCCRRAKFSAAKLAAGSSTPGTTQGADAKHPSVGPPPGIQSRSASARMSDHRILEARLGVPGRR